MARRRNSLPALKFHAATKQHCVYLDGERLTLGRDKAAAEARYRQLVGELLAAEGDNLELTLPPAAGLSVSELLLAYRRHAETVYQVKYLARLHYATLAAVAVHAGTSASDFRGRALKDVRRHLLTRAAHPRAKGDGRPPRPLSRNYINNLISAIRTAFVWAASEDLIPGDNLANLAAVVDLRAHEGGRETEHVMPVDTATVEATLPYCSRVVAAMVRVQRNSGARPQDVCSMRRGELSIDPAERLAVPNTKASFGVSALTVQDARGQTVPIWLCVPQSHKTLKRGKPRVVVLGPPAQEALRPFLDRPADAYLFSPRESERERLAALRAARQTPVQPSQVSRAKRHPRKVKGERYTTDSYRRAIEFAVRRANRARRRADPQAALLPLWTPGQLRHGAATSTAERFDESFAAALLGHSGVDVIATYVRTAIQKAARAAAELG